MQSAIDKVILRKTGLIYVNNDEMIERLYVLLEHRKGENDCDFLKNIAVNINDILVKNNIISIAQHKKIKENNLIINDICI